jgi:predicted nucleic acid-binding protein
LSYLIDTNVWSELRNPGRADNNVRTWAETTNPAELYLSVVTVFELERGVLLIERRDPQQGSRLRRWLEDRVLSPFDGQILPIDATVARRWAALHIPDPRPERDAFIAATALIHGLTVVTRNVGDFEPLGVSLLNPWAPAGRLRRDRTSKPRRRR